MEAELIAASQCTAMVKYIRRVLIEDFRCNLPATPMAEDNTGCIGVAKGGGNRKTYSGRRRMDLSRGSSCQNDRTLSDKIKGQCS